MSEEKAKVEQNEQIWAAPAHPNVRPCSRSACANGHEWATPLAVATCKGCGGQLVAARKLNCPVCNEPEVRITLRVDHGGAPLQVVPACQGAKGGAEVLEVVIEKEDYVGPEAPKE